MKIEDIVLASRSLDELKRLAGAHMKIEGNAEISLDVPFDVTIPDKIWDEAVEAAEKAVLKGIAQNFDKQAQALRNAGFEDVPTLEQMKESLK